MADEENGGTPSEGESTPPTTGMSDADVAVKVEEARKEGQTESWKHFQSEADKQIATERTKNTGLEKQIQELKRTQIDNLPEDERNTAMLKEVYNRLHEESGKEGEVKPQTQPEPTLPASDSAQRTESRTAMSKLLEAEGFDSTKIDWGDGADTPEDSVKRFFTSIKNSIRSESSSSEGDDKKPIDTSRGAGAGGGDITQMSSADLIKSAYKGDWRVRGGKGE